MAHDFQTDIDAVAAIPAIGTILEVVCRTTQLRFAAVARVTESRWICCASQDDIAFGLKPGDELKVETTICNEIRDHRRPVAIDCVADDANFHNHHTPAMYGFQSYISMPIVLADGGFFGTLCAIDPNIGTLNNPSVLGMFRLFAQLIAHELDAHARLRAVEEENEALRDVFRAGLGHDMKNTLTEMAAGTRLLAKTPLNDRAQAIIHAMEASTQKLAHQIGEAMAASR